MDILFENKLCLTPLLIDASGRGAGRVEGVLETRGPGGDVRRFVDAVDYDGETCRYRLAGAAHDVRWLTEDAAGAFRSFACLVVDRLRTLPCEREPLLHFRPGEAPGARPRRRPRRIEGPCTLAVLDSRVGAAGGLWLRAALLHGAPAGGPARERAGDGRREGWFRLADVGPVAGTRSGNVVRQSSSRASPADRRRRGRPAEGRRSGKISGGPSVAGATVGSHIPLRGTTR